MSLSLPWPRTRRPRVAGLLQAASGQAASDQAATGQAPRGQAAPSRFVLLLLATLAPAWTLPVAQAQPVTIYRCTDATGTVTVQNKPCPAGSTQREQTMQGVASSPASAPAGASRPPSFPGAAGDAPTPMALPPGTTRAAEPEPRILDSATLSRKPADANAGVPPGRPAPPALFRCSQDRDDYLSETDTPPARCLALGTVGLDGNPAAGAGQACEVVRDACTRVPDDNACGDWRRFQREAETRWRFAHPDNAARRKAEYARVAKIVLASCGS